jgi:beta-phosphoglucomutase family hydrolase
LWSALERMPIKKMTNNMTKGVIWDMDGVIADTGAFHYRSWQHVFRRQGIVFTEEEFKKHFGQRNEVIIRAVKGGQTSDDEINTISLEKEEYYRQAVRHNVKALPGVIRLLKSLDTHGFACAIGSSAPLENIRVILDGLQIRDFFQAIVNGAEVKEGKPDPQVFILAAWRLNLDPAKCVVIEDAVAGVSAAKKAGMCCIAVTTTHPAVNLKEADLVVDSLEKISIAVLNGMVESKNCRST